MLTTYFYILFFFFMTPLPPRSTLFPYTTLFRSSVQVSITFLAVVSGDDQYRRLLPHANHHIDPKVPFLDRCLVRGQVAVDYKQIGFLADAVVHEPLQALSRITEIPVFLQMYISAVVDAKGHEASPGCCWWWWWWWSG